MDKLSPGTVDMLTTQYVWTVQNDFKWFDGASSAWLHNNLRQFDRESYLAIRRASRDLGGILTAEWTEWVVVELRRQFMQSKVNYDEPVPSNFLKYLPEDTEDHMAKAETILNPVQENLENTIEETRKQNIMNQTAFSTKHFVYGQDVSDMTEEQLIEAIKKIEGEIDNLKTVKTKSKKITDKIAALEVMLGSVVLALDSK